MSTVSKRLNHIIYIFKRNALGYANNKNNKMQADILEVAKKFGQNHLVQHYESLTDPKQK